MKSYTKTQVTFKLIFIFRVKTFYRLNEIKQEMEQWVACGLQTTTHSIVCVCVQYLHSLVIRQCKADGAIPTVDVTDTAFIAPRGIVFCRIVKSELHAPHEILPAKETSLLLSLLDPWQLHASKIGKLYFFDKSTGKSTFDPPQGSLATYLWVYWCSDVCLLMDSWVECLAMTARGEARMSVWRSHVFSSDTTILQWYNDKLLLHNALSECC